MPQLNSSERVIKLALPTTAHLEDSDENKAWVEFNIGPLIANDISHVNPNGTDIEASFAMLAIRIKDWNYTDADGNKLEINVDNVKKLHIDDYTFLAQQFPKPQTEIPADQKKT